MNATEVATNLAFCYFFKELYAKQYRVAERIGITPSSMSRVMHFKRPLKENEVKQFCREYSIPLSCFKERVDAFGANRSVVGRVMRVIGRKEMLALVVFEAVRSDCV